MDMPTRDKIKEVALTLFAKKGYEGTTMNEIAKGVGVKKASLYAHFNGKADLFFAIYEDLAREYRALVDRLFEESIGMEIHDKLYHIFEQFILYFTKNPEKSDFWNRILLFTPPEIDSKFFSHFMAYEAQVQERLEDIFEMGMRKGEIRRGEALKMVMSFRFMREGLLMFITHSQDLREEWIKEFWNDFWLGIKERNKS